MFNSVALDVVIGLVFIYLLYSLLVTIIQEIIANKLSYRAKFLEKAIIRMLEDEKTKSSGWFKLGIHINPITKEEKAANNFSRIFYDHPLIKYLGEKPGKSKPAYLVSQSFSKILIDLLKGDKIAPGDQVRTNIQDSLKSGIIKWNNPGNNTIIKEETLRYLNSIWVDAQGDIERFKEILENWFNETMNRTTGWYKKYTQFISLLIGLIIAIFFNVDTIEIAHRLESDPKLREQIVQQADAYIKAHPDLPGEKEKEKQKIAEAFNRPDTEKASKDSVTIAKQKQIKDSLIDTKQKQIETAYDQLIKKGDSLQKQATELVQKDINATNEILGLGIGSYKLKECKDCSPCKNFWMQAGAFLKSLFGWLLTALALSLGAPFWFDLLNKLMKLRTSVSPASSDDKEKKNEASVAKVKRVG